MVAFDAPARVFSFVTPRDQPKSGRILVGTASWSDPGFVERWYPPKLPAGDRLPWYARAFRDGGSELDLLRRARGRDSLSAGVRATPNEFVFDVKLHRLLSRHAATLKSLPPALQRVGGGGREREGEADGGAWSARCLSRSSGRSSRCAPRRNSALFCCNFRRLFRRGNMISRNWTNCSRGSLR